MLLFAVLALSACVEEPSKKAAEKAAQQVAAEDEDEAAVRNIEAKNIEAAADAAAKLVEEEANQEIDELEGNQIQSADQ